MDRICWMMKANNVGYHAKDLHDARSFLWEAKIANGNRKLGIWMGSDFGPV